MSTCPFWCSSIPIRSHGVQNPKVYLFTKCVLWAQLSFQIESILHIKKEADRLTVLG